MTNGTLEKHNKKMKSDKKSKSERKYIIDGVRFIGHSYSLFILLAALSFSQVTSVNDRP